ncbi:erythromycin esterase family protein [Amycolatopsis sp. PS_44_ISF1]|uniref:erythromycin esterase family protein n=1 Tax=Amycolatopsis sp. PS_44_ISF1 TaxID=2974917 RepID=UPI0028DF5117|nr:erythromycin esterase family protein [Amycolatopsis sp. PS_44_ISF1]MDT8911922.1 erythromycin esterase family protein [Amycolatopsis sp. PS_44_ISF1]
MNPDLATFLPASCELLAFGEPAHSEPVFARVRNELFDRLTGLGFRSIALETDRVAALAVQDFVHQGTGTLDAVLGEGFSHGFGDLEPNRALVSWMREYNETRPPEGKLAFHGFDTPTETMNAPSPRSYLEHARDYLGLDLDLAMLTGEDERWSRTEAILDPAMSPGATPEAERLRTIADDLLTRLYARAPELIAATSRTEWVRARTRLTGGLGLLRYHKQSAEPLERDERISRLSALRDALMARNLLEIRELEARRGPTLVFAHNLHLQRGPSHWELPELRLTWFGAGSIGSSLLEDRYAFIAGSIGRSEALGLDSPAADTYEGALQTDATWSLTRADAIPKSGTRSDIRPETGYFPLDPATVDGADAVLHISDASRV